MAEMDDTLVAHRSISFQMRAATALKAWSPAMFNLGWGTTRLLDDDDQSRVSLSATHCRSLFR